MDISEESLALHYKLRGKLEVVSRYPIQTQKDLSLAYTPGVAAPCLEIQKDPAKSFQLTRRQNLVAVITDGSAVLGLGNIGPLAGMPVMEGKCVLFKEFAGVDAFPLCVDTQDVDEMVETIARISKSFGGINLEDISAPRCFEVERRLKEVCDIPVFHDDQHGTAVVVAAALINALKLAGKRMEDVTCVINGAGSAGVAIAHHLLHFGVGDLILLGRHGIVVEGRAKMSPAQEELSHITNRRHLHGGLNEALAGADVFIGVSVPNIVTADMIRLMARDPIVFPMANPVPEIMPEEALRGGAAVVGTGRSDYDNQINNVLAFPGIFRGALDVRARDINDEMKMAASRAIASLVSDEELTPRYILPEAFDRRVGPAVARAVAEAAVRSGVARLPLPDAQA